MFENPDEARRATQKDRETFGDKFGDRYVRVYPTLDSDISDMQAAVVQQNMVNQQVLPHVAAHSVSACTLIDNDCRAHHMLTRTWTAL